MSSIKNYFEFFGIQEKFDVDLEALRKDFLANSKKFHPDFHTMASEEDQDKILELSSINNEAWKILSDLQHRIAHLLQLKDQLPEEGKAQVPQEFLMEMMDINEALMEIEMEDDTDRRKQIISDLEELEQSLNQEGQEAMAQWDEEQAESALTSVRDYYLKLKYIRRIKDRFK